MDEPATLAPGHLDVEGCMNFRDAGGWAIDEGSSMRTGVLYRADDPVRLTPAGRSVIDALGLAAAVDVRQAAQIARSAGFIEPARTFHRPLVDRVIDIEAPPRLAEPADIADLYEEMIERSRPQVADVLDILANHVSDGPVLVHCAIGKDRTGLVVALIQAAIGVPCDSIAAEYTRSHEPARRRRAWMIDEPLADDPPIARSPVYLWSAPAESMSMLLARSIDRYESLDGWLASFPLSDGTIGKFRAALIETT
jgi:protein-tyrosine phosphatase